MGQITSYTPISAPINVASMIFIADAGASNQIKSTTVTNLSKVPQIWAADGNGLKLTDDDSTGNYGVFIKDGGNVGIGTGAGSPNTFLELNSGARTATFVAGTPSTWTNMLLLNPTDTANAAVGINFQVDNAFDSGSGAGIVGIKSHATNAQMDLAFITDPSGAGSAEAMRILHNGNVGIGTVTPGDLVEIKLDNSGTDRALQLNFPTSSAGCGVKFAQAGTAKAYIQFMGSAYGTVARRSQLEILSTAGITFWPDSGAADVVIDADGNLGVGTTSPTAKIHIEGAGTSPELLLLNNTTVDTQIKLTNNGGNPAYIINAAAYLALGGSTTPAAATHLVIQKSTGRVSIGGTLGTWSYPLTISSSVATAAEFGSAHASKAYIYIVNSASGTAQTAVVFGNAATNNRRWMCGQFWDTSNYFGFEYLGGTTLSGPNDASFNSGTLENTTVYISQAGGISSQNTPVAFGQILTNGSVNPVLTGSYNVSGVTCNSSGEIVVTFSKQASNTTYTVVATGVKNASQIALVGVALNADKLAAKCTINVYPTLDLTATSNDYLSFTIYGAKLKA